MGNSHLRSLSEMKGESSVAKMVLVHDAGHGRAAPQHRGSAAQDASFGISARHLRRDSFRRLSKPKEKKPWLIPHAPHRKSRFRCPPMQPFGGLSASHMTQRGR